MEKTVTAVVQRFPHLKDEILRLVKLSETFQEVCQDYLDAAEAFDWWSKASDAAARDVRRAEYRILVDDLAREIQQMLNAQRPDSSV
ncbi:hypothetical protein K1W69_10905 [Hoeflea sp. WL0058]|uniref:Uncharacterized protein n=1 Tax=Flavimaribacter sediminis TaxID=2865987 RepID=A0AAE2ZMZ7_9HYPH|nr:hypothetical protein [Flavimaribacter sediminis]MBW8637696.1 hypothetical protein [Flavimaribacter sediminis]